jgi:hypothetical protein
MTTAPRSATSRKQTHCQKGHLLSEDNVYYYSSGHRTCKQCRKDRNARRIRPARPDPGSQDVDTEARTFASSSRYRDGDWCVDLTGDITAQAIHDYKHGRRPKPDEMSAAAYLDACGLLLPDGTIRRRQEEHE